MASEEDNQQQMQELYMQYQMMHQQMAQVQQYVDKIGKQIEEINRILIGIDDLDSADKKTEILAPISNGIFVKTQIKEDDALLVNVGANVVVKKTRAETKGLLSKQIDAMQEGRKQAELQLAILRDETGKLEAELKKLVE